MPSPSASSVAQAGRIGRRTGYLLLGALVTAFTTVCTLEIMGQVWFQEVRTTGLECRAGLQGLIQALERARENVGSVREAGNESATLARFRDSLEPEWRARGAVSQACKSDHKSSKALQQIERLRYAEEHAVRYEAQNLARLRRRVQELLRELGIPADSHSQQNFR